MHHNDYKFNVISPINVHIHVIKISFKIAKFHTATKHGNMVFYHIAFFSPSFLYLSVCLFLLSTFVPIPPPLSLFLSRSLSSLPPSSQHLPGFLIFHGQFPAPVFKFVHSVCVCVQILFKNFGSSVFRGSTTGIRSIWRI